MNKNTEMDRIIEYVNILSVCAIYGIIYIYLFIIILTSELETDQIKNCKARNRY
jgi:hypothetical protein